MTRETKTRWWLLYIVAPVVAGVILLIAGVVVDSIFGRDGEKATPPSAPSPGPLVPSPSPPAPLSPSSSPTVREFAQKANEICGGTRRPGEFKKPISGLIRPALNGDKRAEQTIQRQIERFKKELRDRQRRLKALDTPQGEARANAEEFVRTDSSIQEGQLAALSDIPVALKNGDRAALRSLVARLQRTDPASGGMRARRAELALQLGAKQCA